LLTDLIALTGMINQRKSGSNVNDTPSSNLRGHSRKYFKMGALKNTARENFLTCRFMNDCNNKLNEEMVSTKSTNRFKNLLDTRIS
jgi:hypothetical protein